MADQLAILRRFEPVIRYTRGERFFPMDVEQYIRECSLWVQRPGEEAEMVAADGEVTSEILAQRPQEPFGTITYLKFIEPLELIELARYSLDQAVKTIQGRDEEGVFKVGRGRLARVSLFSRLVDALFSIALLMRGRVPGDTAAAAALMYRQLQAEDERYCYYGRTICENGWVVLQYWYFYPFNNWRSGFFGVNDHEGDWEMVSVYCTDSNAGSLPIEQRIQPQWVAYASHDFAGDDLRRHWKDPELQKVGDHPVVYAGAGSHASYFSAGEYLSEIELPFLAPLVKLMDRIQDIWTNWLQQSGSEAIKPEFNVFRVPFVDYARGDGMAIGPGQHQSWEAQILDKNTSWAMEYRGLWGLYASDPIAGENAPAGPVYNRDGSVRRSWFDPLGWAGLDKVPPPHQALKILGREREKLCRQEDELERFIADKTAELVGLGIEGQALVDQPYLEIVFQANEEKINTLSAELAELRRQITVVQDRLRALDTHALKLERGETGPMRAHIHRAHQPSSEVDLRLGRLAEGFAAVSIGVWIIAIAFLFLFARDYLIFGLAAVIGMMVFLEAGFRRRLSQLITSLVIGLAVVTSFILIFEFFWEIVVAVVVLLGFYIIWENVQELRY